MVENQARSRRKLKEIKKTVDLSFLKKYWHYIFCLFIAIFCYFLLYLLLSKVYPNQIQNFIFKNSFLPLFSLLFIANFFLFTFFFLNKKIGFIFAFIINLILYFKISHIYFNFAAILAIALLGLILTLLAFPPRLSYNKPR